MHQQNPVDAPPESRGTTRIRRTPTESCFHLQRELHGILKTDITDHFLLFHINRGKKGPNVIDDEYKLIRIINEARTMRYVSRITIWIGLSLIHLDNVNHTFQIS